MGTTFTRRRLEQRLVEVLSADHLPPVSAAVEVGDGARALAAYPAARLAVVDVADLSAAVRGGDWRILAVDLDQLAADPVAVARRVRIALNRRSRERHPTARRSSSD